MLRVLLILLVAAAPGVELAQWQETTVTDSLKMGYQLVAADLNRDGRPDLIVVDERGTELAWYENPTWERHVIIKDVPRTINLDVYDYDGDGIPEIAMGHNFETVPEKSIGNVLILKSGPDPRRPGLPRVGSALEVVHVADALFRHGFEVVPHGDFWNAVAVIIVNVEIDGARHVLDDYVALPRWILVPGEFSAALVHHDEVRPAIAVQVGDHKLIAHLQGVSNRGLPLLRQFCARQRRSQQNEQDKQHQTNFTRNGVTEGLTDVAPPIVGLGRTNSRRRRSSACVSGLPLWILPG